MTGPTPPKLTSTEYLRHVPIGEVWKQAKAAFFGWLLLSALIGGFALAFATGVEASKPMFSGVPPAVLWLAALAGITWYMRGRTLTIPFPKSVKSWLGFNAAMCTIALALAVLPGWALIPICYGIITGTSVVSDLVEIGKRRYEKNFMRSL